MRRKKELLKKRKAFIENYINDNSNKQMKVIMLELEEKLFITTGTIYGDLRKEYT